MFFFSKYESLPNAPLIELSNSMEDLIPQQIKHFINSTDPSESKNIFVNT